jgi:hypothetical protein
MEAQLVNFADIEITGTDNSDSALPIELKSINDHDIAASHIRRELKAPGA